MIQAAEKAKIFARGEAAGEPAIAAGVLTELAPDGTRLEDGVVASNSSAALGRQEQRGENAKQRGFAGAVRAKQGQSFAGAHFERDSRERDDARFFEWLEKGAPAAAGGGKRLFE